MGTTRKPKKKLKATHPTCGSVEGLVLAERPTFYTIELTDDVSDDIKTYRKGSRIIVPKATSKGIKVTDIA